MDNMERDRHESGSVAGVLAGVADVGASTAAGGPRRIWETARKGTDEVGSALPESMGLGSVKHFIQRHPVVSTCAALALAYVVLGGYLPVVGRALRFFRGPR